MNNKLIEYSKLKKYKILSPQNCEIININFVNIILKTFFQIII